MLTFVLLTLGLACRVDGPGDSADCTPVTGSLPRGSYGGNHYELTVSVDGSAELRGDCSLASVGSTPVDDGAVNWLFSWQSGYGLPVQDSAEVEYIDVAFVGTACGETLEGTLTFPDASTAPLSVTKGAAPNLLFCQ